MGNLFEKGMLAGLGLIDLTRERLGALVDELVERGEVSKQDAGDLTDRLWERGRKEKELLEKRLRDLVDRGVERADLCRRSDLDGLERRLAALEERLGKG